MYMKNIKCFLSICLISITLNMTIAQNPATTDKGIDKFTPSKAIYFDWINLNWYGSNEKKVKANLIFFKWYMTNTVCNLISI